MKRKYIIITVLICFIGVSMVFFINSKGKDITGIDNKDSIITNSSTKNQDKIDSEPENNKGKEIVEKREKEEMDALKSVTSCSSDDNAKQTIRKLLSILYFNRGSYNEYKEMFIFKDRIMNEDKFNSYRKNSSAKIKENFGKNYSDEDEIVNLLSIKQDKNVTIVFLKEPDGTSKMQWNVVEKQGKNYIYNSIIK